MTDDRRAVLDRAIEEARRTVRGRDEAAMCAEAKARLRADDITALQQTLAHLKATEGLSHNGYFVGGWAGAQLQDLLRRLESGAAE